MAPAGAFFSSVLVVFACPVCLFVLFFVCPISDVRNSLGDCAMATEKVSAPGAVLSKEERELLVRSLGILEASLERAIKAERNGAVVDIRRKEMLSVGALAARLMSGELSL